MANQGLLSVLVTREKDKFAYIEIQNCPSVIKRKLNTF